MQRLPLALRDFWSRLKGKNSNNTECVLIWNRPIVNERKIGKKKFIPAVHVGKNFLKHVFPLIQEFTCISYQNGLDYLSVNSFNVISISAAGCTIALG